MKGTTTVLDYLTDEERLKHAWGLVTFPMVHTSYTQAVLQFLRDADGEVCPRALLMLELAAEIHQMRGSFELLMSAWRPHRRQIDTAPGRPRALRGAA